LYKYFRSQGLLRRSFHYGFDSYLLVYGFYIVSRLWLRNVKPAGVVVSNDHGVITRSFTLAAKHMGISTFYLPHASITEKFPPLMFDYAFLDGLDALCKYESCGPSKTKIFLIGIPKLDPYINQLNHRPVVSTIGVCTNKFDAFERVEELCKMLRKSFPDISLFLRPHPGDTRRMEWKGLAENFDIHYSDSRVETSFEFLKGVDVILAGESNILLEAALINVLPIYYDFPRTHMDWYGFQRQGLVEYVSEIEEVFIIIQKILKNRPDVRIKTKYYCATVDSRYDGQSTELTTKLIKALVSDQDLDWKEWKSIQGSKLDAYELCES
jgi:hypothetical protein